MSGRSLGYASAQKLRDKQKQSLNKIGAFQAEAVTVSGGMVYIKETGIDEIPWEQGIVIVESALIDPGDHVLIIPTKGGDYVCVGSIEPASIMRVRETNMYENSASTASNSPTTSTSLVDAINLNIPGLPAGTYSVVVTGSVALSHSTGGTVQVACKADGTTGTTHSMAVPTTSPATTRIAANHTFTGITLNGSEDLTTSFQYSSVTAGTTTGRNPQMTVFVRRDL
jgi:hypothetical protein